MPKGALASTQGKLVFGRGLRHSGHSATLAKPCPHHVNSPKPMQATCWPLGHV
jgi:hypothetical protein